MREAQQAHIPTRFVFQRIPSTMLTDLQRNLLSNISKIQDKEGIPPDQPWFLMSTTTPETSVSEDGDYQREGVQGGPAILFYFILYY
jgi:hypothetical protein